MSALVQRFEPVLRLRPCRGFWQRLVGLLGRSSIDADEALWIDPCRAIHTFGMRFAIDVVFLDRRGVVLRVVPALLSWRLAACSRASSVIEMSAGTAERIGLEAGDRIEMIAERDGQALRVFQRRS